MRPRTILYTGKGGVGKTSVAACTARACARAGLRTLVLSTDPAHSLSESLEAELGADPAPVSELLWGQEVKAQEEMERHWSGVQDWLGELFVERGVDRISAEELTVPPGMDELFSLLRLQGHHQSGEWDAIIVDCAPTGETLRLLSFPDVARWWIEKVFPMERQILAAARPLARSLLDIPLPSAAVFADIQRLSQNLIAMNEILRDREHSTVRLVMNPDRMVIGEAMRTFTYLNLYGYLTDAVVVNRVFPSEVGDYFAGWRRVQEEHLDLVRSAFAPVPVLRAPYFDREVIGAEMLDRLAGELFDGHAAEGVLHDTLTQQLDVGDDGATLRLALPFARKGDIALKKIGLELVVRVDGQKRTITLPSALAAFRPTEASFEDGALEVKFDGAPRSSQSEPRRRGRA
jgi:arsenite-transporting ATPase